MEHARTHRKEATARQVRTATRTNPMKALRERLGVIGVSRSFLNKAILPEWWDDDIAKTPAGYSEGLVYLSRRLGVSQRFLSGESDTPFTASGPTKFKTSAKTDTERVRLAQSIAVSAASLARAGASVPYSLAHSEALDIRREILDGTTLVTLGSLLDFCWTHGIPAIHLTRFPKGVHKMDGLCAIVEGRPAIVVSRRSKYPAWLVFILAHELGHIFENHITGDDSVLVDQEVETFDVDGEEQQANTFASAVLTGRNNLAIRGPRQISGERLAEAARQFGAEHGIDPGVVVLNYAWTMKNFACANKALEFLEPEIDAVGLFHKKMLDYLDRDAIPDESFEWLLRITEAESYA